VVSLFSSHLMCRSLGYFILCVLVKFIKKKKKNKYLNKLARQRIGVEVGSSVSSRERCMTEVVEQSDGVSEMKHSKLLVVSYQLGSAYKK